MKLSLFACLVFLYVAAAQAKCVTEWYEFRGNISDAGGTPVANALIEISWDELGKKLDRHASTVVDPTGAYELSVPFYNFSRVGGSGDVCEAILLEVMLRVSSPEFVTSETVLRVDEKIITANISLQSNARQNDFPAER